MKSPLLRFGALAIGIITSLSALTANAQSEELIELRDDIIGRDPIGRTPIGRPPITRPPEQREVYGLMGNSKFESKVVIGQTTQSVVGRTSFILKTNPELLKNKKVAVDSFNLLFTGVEQPLLTGKKTIGKSRGVVGISRDPNAKQIVLEYFEENLTLRGAIPVQMHFPQIDELIPPKKADYDVFFTKRLPARLLVQFQLDKPLSRSMGAEPIKITLGGTLKFEFQGANDNDLRVNPMFSELLIQRLPVDFFPLIRFEVGRNLCLQPVRIKSSASDGSPTGAGLAFGMPGANTQWKKADIIFSVRNWKEIISSTLKVADNSTEESQIRSSVQDDDCIEIFFVENFNPVDSHGGGATWASGTASAQIISSDGNATGGIDFTHLAHELGHVLALGHPSGSPGLVSGNTGTLMCPSGWRRDNPTINSQGNKTNADNPLLTFTLKLRGPNVDCQDNTGCGPCPF